MAVPAEQMPRRSRVGRRQGLTEPLRLAQGVTRGELAAILGQASTEAAERVRFLLAANADASAVAQARAVRDGLASMSQSMWGRIGNEVRRGVRDAASLAADQEVERLGILGMPTRAIQQYGPNLVYRAQQAAEDILSRRTNGFTLQDRIYRNGKLTTKQVGDIVERGLARQLSARDLARQVRAHFRPDVKGGTSYAANRLARTEINNAHHDTTIRVTESAPWTNGYRWNLSGSHPRPDICNEYAEDDHSGIGAGVFSVRDVPSKPHPQCLCYVTVVQPSREDFMASLLGGQYSSYLAQPNR